MLIFVLTHTYKEEEEEEKKTHEQMMMINVENNHQ
jgi:hypothetical protein